MNLMEKIMIKHFGFVYLWFDIKRKKFCIGSHYGQINDGYISSTGHMKQAYKKRPKTFKRKILWYLTEPNKKILLEKEQVFLNMIKDSELGIKYYNYKKTASGGNGYVNRGTTKEKCEWRRRQAVTITGRTKETFPHLLVSSLKISKALKGRSKETHEYINKVANILKSRNKNNHPGVRSQSEKLKGRTKETHASIKSQSEKIRKISEKQDLQLYEYRKQGLTVSEAAEKLQLSDRPYQSIVTAANRGKRKFEQEMKKL